MNSADVAAAPWGRLAGESSLDSERSRSRAKRARDDGEWLPEWDYPAHLEGALYDTGALKRAMKLAAESNSISKTLLASHLLWHRSGGAVPVPETLYRRAAESLERDSDSAASALGALRSAAGMLELAIRTE